MSFNNRNLNPNIWDAPRHNNPPSFINNQPNFYGNNNSNFGPNRPNFNSQQNSIRPLLSLPQMAGPNDHQQNFRNFNNNSDFQQRNNNNNRGRPNFHNQQKWQNRGNDNKDSRFNESKDNSNNGERLSREPSSSDNSQNDESRPKSLVEQLKSTMMKKNPRSNSQENNTSESIDVCAKNASKKLLSQLKTMDKDNVKELINNPKQPHRKAVLNIQAREKLREGMRKQLKTLGAEDDQEACFDAVDSVNYENIPETLIAQIGQTVDMDLGVEDMDLQPDMDDDNIVEDKDIEVVTKNLGNDFLYGSEMLLMNGFNLLGESENESDLKIPDDRFNLPPLPAEPINKPPEPVPPPEIPISPINKMWTEPLHIKPPPIVAQTHQRYDDWEIDSARNPDPPHLNQPAVSESIQSIPVIVSHPPPTQQILPPATITNINNNNNNVSTSKKVVENPLLISLSEANEQNTTTKTSTINNSLNNSTIDDKVFKTPQSLVSQDPFKTPSIPEPIPSTPILDGGKTPFIGNDDGSRTPFVSFNDGGKTPYIGAGDDCKTPSSINEDLNKKSDTSTNQVEDPSSKPEQRANETYGEYRRRLANLGVEEVKPKEDFNKPTQRPQPQRKTADWDEPPPSTQNDSKNNWLNNSRNNINNNNNNNNENNRKSRFEMNRSRDRNNRNNFNNSNNNNNNNNRRNADSWDNNSRDNRDNRDRDREKSNDMRDPFNYRFDNKNNATSQDVGEMNRLNTILNPKPVQFKGSFNKRSGFGSREYNNRSRSREKTPVNNSVEREFVDGSLPSPSDARPCYHTLKKIVEIESEISRIHDKIHGIDKVISNLQSERIGYQKTFTRLQHDKKILFDNLVKRAMTNENNSNERTMSRERENKEKDREKSSKSKNIEPNVEQKKRKIDDTPQVTAAAAQDIVEEIKKKKKYTIEEEPKSAAQKAKEKEDEERRKRIEEIRRQKQLRREREEAERRKLEEEVKKQANDTILILNRDKIKKKEKERQQSPAQTVPQPPTQKPHKHEKSKDDRILFNMEDVIDPNNVKMKKLKIKFGKISLQSNILDQYKSGKYPEIDVNDLSQQQKQVPNTTTVADKAIVKSEKPETEIKIKKEDEQSKKQSKSADPLNITVIKSSVKEKDPLAIDDNEEVTNPPTPGSNLTLNDNDETNSSDKPNPEPDYSEWTGTFESHDQPIVHIQNIDGKYMVCAAEDGKLYKYRFSNGKCEATFAKHTEICNSFLYEDRENTIYTASSDGFVYRIKFKAFDSIASKQFNEPLQVIEKSKYALYVGAKSGNIYKLKLDLSDDDLEPLCCVDSLILCMRWTKEGSRHILLISSRMSAVQVRDANDGLLLRTFSNDLTGVSIYDMLLEGSTIYCGSNLHEIFALDFTTGALIKKRSMSGAGAICVRLYKENLIVACYDGNIYIFNINADDDAVNITGPSNMLLAMDLWNDKIIASTKDKTLKIMNIPT